MAKRKDPTEIIRHKLNELPEKDANGNYGKFGSQFFTWIVGGIVESSDDKSIRKLGKTLRNGAEKSFADYMGQKVSNEITKLFRSQSQ